MVFSSRADFSDKSELITSTKFMGETIELVKLGIGWRPWHYQVNCYQGTLHYFMANFSNEGDAMRSYERSVGELK